jgi:hypothetical protein
MEKELDSLREAMGRKRWELDVLRDEWAQSGRELTRETETNRALRAQVDRLKILLQLEEAKQAHDAELRRRYPFCHEHMEHVRKKCGSKEGNSTLYPHKGKIGEAEVDFHDYHVLMSPVGEYHWKYLEAFAGFPSWRTIQRWREELEAEIRLDEGVFGGTRHNLDLLIRIIRARLDVRKHPARARVAVLCDAVSSVADVVMEANGNVRD